MKKKILIIVGIIALFIIGVFIYFVVSDLGQEEKLKTELNEINEMVNAENIDVDSIYKRLNRTLTKGDYAKVEKAFKNYLKDNFDNSIKIAELISDEKITNILTVENYKEDGKDFIGTKKYIVTTIKELENCKNKYTEFFSEEKAMSYININELDSYYIDLYKQEFVGDIEPDNNDQTVQNSIDDIVKMLNVSEEIINFLSENQNFWQIEGENIVFDNDNLSNIYNELIDKL